jgi:hypothetical protein
LFGLIVGLSELPADAWLTNFTRSLDYWVGGGPMLWPSPVWMPLAWEIVARFSLVTPHRLHWRTAWAPPGADQ